MIKVHVISNLDLYDNEWADTVDETLPECDVVFISGNNGYVKRSMLFTETLCKKYPNIQFVYLNGKRELIRQKVITQISDGLTARKAFSELWPPNLHYSFEKPFTIMVGDKTLDILCLHGYPLISEKVSEDIWKSTTWFKFVNHAFTEDPSYCRPQGISDACRGPYPVWSTPELCKDAHTHEHEIVNRWIENKQPDTIQILVTSLSPVEDISLPNINYVLFPNIKVDYWLAGGSNVDLVEENYYLHTNSGRGSTARGKILIIDK